jgi:hypothetical protein
MVFELQVDGDGWPPAGSERLWGCPGPAGEGWTIVVNPAGLSQIKRREELPSQ